LIIDALVIVIMFIAVLQAMKYNINYSLPVILYALINFYYGAFMSGHQNEIHYMLGAFLALVIAGLISLCGRSRVAVQLQLICVIDIMLNIAGWVLYEAYQEPYIHEWLFIALYLYAIYAIIKYEGIRYGNSQVGWRGGFFANDFSGRYSVLLRGKKPV
jgi:hypothetical protein